MSPSGWEWRGGRPEEPDMPAGHVLYVDIDALVAVAGRRSLAARALDEPTGKVRVDGLLRELSLDPRSEVRVSSGRAEGPEWRAARIGGPEALALHLARDRNLHLRAADLTARVRHQARGELVYPGCPVCLVGRLREPTIDEGRWTDVRVGSPPSRVAARLQLSHDNDLVWDPKLFRYDAFCVGIVRVPATVEPLLRAAAIVL